MPKIACSYSIENPILQGKRMNLPFLISKRISKEAAGSFSNIINRIAVISIALGLAVLMLAFMVLYGFKKEIKGKIFSFSGHLIVSKYTLSTSFEESSITITDSLIHKLKSYPLTERVQPYAMKAALLKTEEEVQGVIVKGVDESFDSVGFSKHMVEGRLPDLSKKDYSTEVALSKRVSNYLELSVNDEVLIYFVQNPPRFRRLQITGIYETGLEEFDEKIILGDLDLVRRINNWSDSTAGGIEVFISDIDKLEQAETDLHNAVDIDLYVDKVTDKYRENFQWLSMLDRNVVILLTIILFVSGTSIISILLILIMERTQMIGALKSIGATNRLIRRVFVLNGLRLIVQGLIWGNLIGLSLGLMQYYLKIIPLDQANYYMSHVPIVIDPWTIIGLNLLVLSLIGVTLLIPVAIISRISPVKAIRFD
ncbi:lipoprotein-releasing system permease protein [Ekhidna lutea]|uniref:Lipoprotein-releasing system permease protein n=1 Tax=Ekhidna lutea TaxID=447679 RepID=A0A239HX97_EKHLU|nr:FtsX-like permease family protein [Ekhidna lutea]SNS85688.1 lipoprotein-releasing system permease protein [Ekhidna lutea]